MDLSWNCCKIARENELGKIDVILKDSSFLWWRSQGVPEPEVTWKLQINVCNIIITRTMCISEHKSKNGSTKYNRPTLFSLFFHVNL